MKVTMENGMVFEGTVEEFAELNKSVGSPEKIDTITVDGVDYKKVDREAEVGELIVIVARDECEDNYDNGAVSKVTYKDDDGDVNAKFDDDKEYYVLRAEYNVLVEAKDEISALKAKIAELEGRVKAEPERLKVGDYAKVLRNNSGSSAKVGGIYKILSVDLVDGHYRLGDLDGNEITAPYVVFEEVVHATPEEVAEAKAKLAKVEEEAKWAKLGRKVGEFKKGDVVKFLGRETSHGLNEHKGIITTIISDDGPQSPYRLKKPSFVYSSSDTWTKASELELIAPVESVVNLSVQG